jgi:haloacetate dehalogenase
MVSVMEHMGFARFSVAGHDRGGRVAYRLALDHPMRVERLAVLDIVPTATVWERADARFALAYWPWILLAQQAPLPEHVLAATAEAIVDNAAEGWGSAPEAFARDVRAAYAAALKDAAHAHAICEEYRAATTLDWEHDKADRRDGRRIACPVLAMWAAGGTLDTWYADAGGPAGLWREWSTDVRDVRLDAGHFFPEELPERTAAELGDFFA